MCFGLANLELIYKSWTCYLFTPPGSNILFCDWWWSTVKGVPRGSHKGLNSLIILFSLCVIFFCHNIIRLEIPTYYFCLLIYVLARGNEQN